MSRTFQADGVRFKYPENWTLTREDSDTGWTVAVQSPGSAFFVLTFDAEMPEVGVVAETVLQALRTDYPDLEAEETIESILGQPAVGHDIQFFTLDFTNTCITRSFYAETGTLLAMWQATDLDLDAVLPVFHAIRASIHVGDER